MKKKIVVLIIMVLIMGVFLFAFRKKYSYEDENTLYYIELGKTILRFERYDYSLGQNQIIEVQKSENEGKTFEDVTEEKIIVSMKPKFIFLNEKLGFAIAKSNLTKDNDYMGVKVTQDGGKTFADGTINYDNPDINVLTILDVPMYDQNILKLNCSIYQATKDGSGYEDIELIFVSFDNGLTWNLV